MKEKEWIKNHPYFVKEHNDATFFFRKDDDEYKIVICNDEEERYPIKWSDKSGKYVPIWEAESWFKKIYIQVNELYFKNKRIRMLTKGIKRDIYNILLFTCLEEEKGEEIYLSLTDLGSFKTGYVLKEHESVAKRIKEMAQKERYEVIVVEKNDQVLAVTIH